MKHVMKLILIYYEKWGNSEPIHGIFVMNAIYIDPVFTFTRHRHHVCNVVLSKKSSYWWEDRGKKLSSQLPVLIHFFTNFLLYA